MTNRDPYPIRRRGATIQLECMGLDWTAVNLLPAVILGSTGLLPQDATAWPWLVSSHHQYGGLACSQEHLFGLLLPLETAPQVRAS